MVECYEHRWVTQCFDPDLEVHHINGVKHDNRPENLVVLTPSGHKEAHYRNDTAEIVRLYQSGLSTLQVGARLGLHHTVVNRALRRAGVERRSISEALRMAVDMGAIERLHGQGVRARRIAKVLDISPSMVDARVRELGLTPHRDGRPTNAEIASAQRAIAEFLRVTTP